MESLASRCIHHSLNMSVNANIDMNSTSSTVKGYFRLGKRTTDVIEFDSDTTLFDVYGYIYQWFNDIIPKNFHINFYSFEKQQIFLLDGDLLESVNNPFRSDSTDTNQEMIDKIDCLQFLIIPDPLPAEQINSQSNIVSLSDELDAALFDTTLPNEFHNALLPPSLLLNLSYEIVSDNNISVDNACEVVTNDDDTMEDNSAAENSQMNSQNSISSLNEYQVAAQTSDENVSESDRIFFSHDVHPDQRHRYLSDKYNTEDGLPKNGDIACLQGTKTEEDLENGVQVLPQLLIPRLLRQLEEFTLLCYAVYEEKDDQTRIWYLNHRKGFLLPDQLNANAKLLNPFPLVLNNTQLTINGDYTLKILLLTNLDKSVKSKKEIYQLDEHTVRQIHTAENIQVSTRVHLKPTRILCVPVINSQEYWPLFAISNFIHPLSKKSRPVSLSNTTTVLLPTATVHLNTMDITNFLPTQQQSLLSAGLNTIAAVKSTPPPPKKQKV